MPPLPTRYFRNLHMYSSSHFLKPYQALDFLSSHSATIVILLKNETDYVPLALLEEIHLIVTLCANVLPSVPKSELVCFLFFANLRELTYPSYPLILDSGQFTLPFLGSLHDA